MRRTHKANNQSDKCEPPVSDSGSDYETTIKTNQKIQKNVGQQKRRRNNAYRETHESFGRQGYIILKSEEININVDPLLHKIRKSKKLIWESIFQFKMDAIMLQSNSHFFETFNSKRQQAVSNDKSFITKLNNIMTKYVGDQNECSDIVVLKSWKGCQPQCIHCDYDDTKVDEFKHDYTIGGIVALEHGAKLLLYKESINSINNVKRDQIKEIAIEKGDMFLFVRYLPHGGGGYDEENTRLHFLCRKSLQI
ncbi:hypothetical protein ROZALSC1DRAFT_24987 [Rozella allomycis CSF55]|uniref:Uncharacterized protein n=1 Tax=Rozella allomycis (strain CSF55) TaxID=988480 RepID=A0A4P9YDK0_ROZAC|nr:hypothetical protein ROZALSC1DRAFT_24987 [Rozella allomycis CSF55]